MVKRKVRRLVSRNNFLEEFLNHEWQTLSFIDKLEHRAIYAIYALGAVAFIDINQKA